MCCQHKPERPDANVRKNRTMPANRISPLHALPRGSQAWQFRAVSRLRDSDFRVRPSRGASPVTELGFQNVAYGGASAADFHRVPLPETDINFSGKNRYLGGQKKSSIKENFTKKRLERPATAPRDRTPRPYPATVPLPPGPAEKPRAKNARNAKSGARNACGQLSQTHASGGGKQFRRTPPPEACMRPRAACEPAAPPAQRTTHAMPKPLTKKRKKMLEKKCAPYSKGSAAR